jgi:hypothetical protein
MAPAAAAATALGVIIALSILSAAVFLLFIRKRKTKKEKYGGAMFIEQKPKPAFTASKKVILATPLQRMEDNPFLTRANSTMSSTDAIVAEKQTNAMRYFAQTKSIPNVLRTPSIRAGTTIEDQNGRKAFTFNEIRAQPQRKPMRTLNEEDLNASVEPKLELLVPTEPLDLFENRRVSTDSGIGVVPVPNSVTMPSVNSRRASTQSNFIAEATTKSHRRRSSSRRRVSSDEESETESERRHRRKRSSRRHISSDEESETKRSRRKKSPKVERELPPDPPKETPKEMPKEEPKEEAKEEPKEEPKEAPKPKRKKSRSKVTHEPVPVAVVEEPAPEPAIQEPAPKIKKRKSSKKNLPVE